MPLSDIVSKIKEKTGLDEIEINKRIEEKLRSLDGLVSPEGAAYIIAHELDVQLFEQLTKKEQKVSELLVGMRNATVVGKVTRTFDPRTFDKAGRKGIVGSFFLADETGEIRVVIWDDRANWLKEGKLAPGKVVKVKDAYVKEARDQNKELHLNLRSMILLDIDKEVNVSIRKSGEFKESKLSESKNGDNLRVYGTVVKVFPPKFYEVCPACGKKVQPSDKGVACPEHGEVEPKPAAVFSIVLDDGSDNLRLVFFREHAEKAMGMTAKEAQGLAENEMLLMEKLNDKLLGKDIEADVAVRENKAFDRKELIANSVNLEPNPIIIARKLMK
jgi:ssDNA-binding replication factor A large subunit